MGTLLVLTLLFSLSSANLLVYYDISGIGWEKLDFYKSHLQDQQACKWWIEVGDTLIAYAEPNSLLAHNMSIELTRDPIFIVAKVHVSHLEGIKDRVLLHNLGFAIIQAPIKMIYDSLTSFPVVNNIRQFDYSNIVLVKQASNTKEDGSLENHADPAQAVSIQTLVNAVSQSRWFSDVTSLAGYNRYTKGSGIASAQKWILDQLAPLQNLVVTTMPFTSGSTSGVNIIATIMGTSNPNKWVIVGGHYDSTSQSPNTAAPGADDDASGSAAVLEMARVFNEYPPSYTALFIFYSGEEQGLYGSAAHAQLLVNNGTASKVQLMHNMDMIAYQKAPPNQVIFETEAKWANTLFPYYRASASRFTDLRVFESTTAWGSDHESYLKRGMPGLLTIDKDWDIYPYYHKTTDTPDKLTPALGYQIMKLGVGAVAQVLGYPF